jgi:hypothetical protein
MQFDRPLISVNSTNNTFTYQTGTAPEDRTHNISISNGFYNKDRKTISIQRSEKCKSDSPSEMVKDVINMMRVLKDKPDRHMEKLNPVRLKRGPKKR